jgi:hypothetical protein
MGVLRLIFVLLKQRNHYRYHGRRHTDLVSPRTKQKGGFMDLQTLSDRAEIIDLISKYNKASFYCDVKGYADTFTSDGDISMRTMAG